MKRLPVPVTVLALLSAGCDGSDAGLAAALDAITVEGLASHTRMLASDDFEGRRPSSPGEQKTIAYLQSEFERLGLEPGNAGSFFQEVPLVATTPDSGMTLTIRGGGVANRFAYGTEFMAWTTWVVERAALANSEIVFVGYGIVAPEYGWNDYEGVDVGGKTVVVLVNDPGFATQDATLFNGNAMTYYGRWTYKYEEAARRGAAGVLIVHETAPAGYPWDVVSTSWSGPQFDLVRDDNNMARAAVEGWLTLESARAVFRQAGLAYDSLKALAAARGFGAIPLGLHASLTMRNTVERSTSNNVLGVLPGVGRPDEYVVYMAHWDHLGRDPALEGDQIYNGALDNATGTAGILMLAQAFTSLEERPARSLLFLCVTAEEQGLLGSAYYAAHPTAPLHKTVAVINMDMLNIWGPMHDITVVGHGMSELDEYLAEAMGARGRVVRPDPEPEKGFYYRSDHFNFAKAGVPALYTRMGIDHVDGGEDLGRAQHGAYTAERYHQPSDEYDPAWDLRGAVDDLRLLFRVGHRLAHEAAYPNWRPGTEFKAARDSMMARR